jgi:hypothetical protein
MYNVLYPHVDLGYNMKWKGIRNEGKEAGKIRSLP